MKNFWMALIGLIIFVGFLFGLSTLVSIGMRSNTHTNILSTQEYSSADNENDSVLNQNIGRYIDNETKWIFPIVTIILTLVAIIALVAAFITILISLKVRQIETARKEIEVEIGNVQTALNQMNKWIVINKLESEIRYFATRKLWKGMGRRGEKLIEIEPEHFGGYLIYGLYQGIYKNQYDKAYELIQKADQLIGGDSPQIKYNLACFASRESKIDNAIEHLNECVFIDKDYTREMLNEVDHDLDNIRYDNRFKDILRYLGIPQ